MRRIGHIEATGATYPIPSTRTFVLSTLRVEVGSVTDYAAYGVLAVKTGSGTELSSFRPISRLAGVSSAEGHSTRSATTTDTAVVQA